ncbi:DUF3857 domain-containing protein [Pontimicrobium aquaticum]|uniref:DUF3857 domain-containing protein n=1 Tax=Pontimicrobium aquaticum TaxID=2565367 RepID=A0A4U0EZV7_9FLAO|nr:DUF3857 domain-containing protein [Pontimicrobium aquaticum]TJY36994.1 DUF3857 domain-containing protein [Pontimicrobium aquaticum]
MKKLFSLLFLVICFSVKSQNYNYGKISKEDFSTPIDSEDDAVILYKNRKTNFDYNASDGWVVVTKIHQRIKINSKSGLGWGTHSRLLLKSGENEEEEMVDIKGATYNLTGGKIEKTKLKNNGIFEEDLNKYRNKVSLTMPNVKEGSVIEYQYTIRSPFWNIKRVDLQYDIPIKKAEVKINIPEYFIYNRFQKGYHPLELTQTTSNRKIQYVWRETTGVIATERRESELDFKETRYLILANNIPSMKNEKYVNNINNYRTSFLFELAQYRRPNSIFKNYSLTWDDVVNTIYRSDYFGAELKKTGYYKDDIDAIISANSSLDNRVYNIYNFVKSKVKWNGYYGKHVDQGVRKAYKEQTGNVAEINLMLTSMLKYAGLNANPVLISTRSNGIPLFPTLNGYNYVVAGVEGENGVILLDATDKFSSPDILPFRALNWEGRLVREDGSSSLINLYPEQASKSTISMMVKLNANGDIEGSYRKVVTNHDAMLYRENYVNMNKDQYLEDLENSFTDLVVSDFQVKNDKDLSKPVMESYSFNLENQLDNLGGQIFITPLFFLAEKENPFKLEQREYPIDFGYPSEKKYRINISLPEGYDVESMPESVAFTLPENIGSFKYIISRNGSTIQVLVDFAINQPIISAEYYSTIKDLFKQIIDKENEQIILKKM